MSQKARRGIFAKLLDDQVPPGARIVECGCGTGQLSNFLSVANRTVFGADMCLNSLRLGQRFKQQHGLSRAHFVQMNLFRPVFAPGSFDLVISNGVLHHTAEPFRAFRSISTLVKPGGYILVGLYHRWGRLITDFRRRVLRSLRSNSVTNKPHRARCPRPDHHLPVQAKLRYQARALHFDAKHGIRAAENLSIQRRLIQMR